MNLRFYLDPDTELPHIYGHNVREEEVLDVLRRPLEEIKGRQTSLIVIGQTRAGRFLKVIYVPDEDGRDIFVVTAYDLSPRELHALRRRQRRRQR